MAGVFSIVIIQITPFVITFGNFSIDSCLPSYINLIRQRCLNKNAIRILNSQQTFYAFCCLTTGKRQHFHYKNCFFFSFE